MYRAKVCEHDQLQEITKREQVRQVRTNRHSSKVSHAQGKCYHGYYSALPSVEGRVVIPPWIMLKWSLFCTFYNALSSNEHSVLCDKTNQNTDRLLDEEVRC